MGRILELLGEEWKRHDEVEQRGNGMNWGDGRGGAAEKTKKTLTKCCEYLLPLENLDKLALNIAKNNATIFNNRKI